MSEIEIILDEVSPAVELFLLLPYKFKRESMLYN